jgi:hypothetical protein
MARQSGHIKYKGTIGDVRHFKIKGLKGDFAGLKGGVDGDRIKNGAEFKRTRENMSEFGGSAKAGKYFRQVLSPIMKGVAETRIAGRVTGLMKKINVEDGSEARGQRAILMTARKDLLKGFDFNTATPFDGIFRSLFALEVSAERNKATLMIAGFNPKIYLNSAKGATHFRLTFAVASLSDFVFNPNDNDYEAKIPTSGLLAVSYSDFLSVMASSADISLSADLPNGARPSEDESFIVCLGVEFYQQVNNEFYLFATGNCLKIIDVR